MAKKVQMLLDYPGETKMLDLIRSFGRLVKYYGSTQMLETETGKVVYEARFFRSFRCIEEVVLQEAVEIHPELVDEEYCKKDGA